MNNLYAGLHDQTGANDSYLAPQPAPRTRTGGPKRNEGELPAMSETQLLTRDGNQAIRPTIAPPCPTETPFDEWAYNVPLEDDEAREVYDWALAELAVVKRECDSEWSGLDRISKDVEARWARAEAYLVGTPEFERNRRCLEAAERLASMWSNAHFYEPGVRLITADPFDTLTDDELEAMLSAPTVEDAAPVTSIMDRLMATDPEYAQKIIDSDRKLKGDPLYVDVAALLAGNLEIPAPTLGVRSDHEAFIYAGKVNVIFGPPETGKTLAVSAIAADTLFMGGKVLWLDLDHNGAEATIARFRSFGVSAAVLGNPLRFRLALPEEKDEVLNIVKDARKWGPTLVALDSIGEVLQMFGANSNSDDDYRGVHRAVLSAMAIGDTGVVAIDHEAKGQSSRDFGSAGAVAKKAAVNGVMLRATLVTPFTPGKGGKVALSITKDRAGGVRAISPANGEREPLAALFELSGGDAINWKFWAPEGASRSNKNQSGTDLEMLQALTPPATSIRDVMRRLAWGTARATHAFHLYSNDRASTP